LRRRYHFIHHAVTAIDNLPPSRQLRALACSPLAVVAAASCSLVVSHRRSRMHAFAGVCAGAVARALGAVRNRLQDGRVELIDGSITMARAREAVAAAAARKR
jgi:hypothetical protein